MGVFRVPRGLRSAKVLYSSTGNANPREPGISATQETRPELGSGHPKVLSKGVSKGLVLLYLSIDYPSVALIPGFTRTQVKRTQVFSSSQAFRVYGAPFGPPGAPKVIPRGSGSSIGASRSSKSELRSSKSDPRRLQR